MDKQKVMTAPLAIIQINSVTVGKMKYLGEFDSKVLTFRYHPQSARVEDGVLIVVDSTKDYLTKDQTELSPDGYKAKERDLNE